MLQSLETNLRYLERVTQDDGRLALGTRERRQQEEYFGEGEEPETNDEDDDNANV